MKQWIDINEKQPGQGQIVLVLGQENSEFGAVAQGTIGLVQWESAAYSPWVSTIPFSLWFTNITHWKPVSENLSNAP